MSYQLQRGQNVSLTQLAASLQEVAVGLGWDVQTGPGASIDLDSSAFMVDESGKVPADEYFIFFNNLISPDGAVEHRGNNTTGIGEGDDEVMTIRLSTVGPHIQKIVFTVTIYDADNRGQHFGLINNAFIRIVNLRNKQEIVRYNLTERFQSETAMVFGELYRYKGDWKFRAVGQGFAGGLQAMADTYGVSTDEEEPAAPPPSPPPPQPAPQPTAAPPSPTPSATPQVHTGVTGLQYELLYPGAYTMLKVHLRQGEEVKAESNAMIAMESAVDVESKMEGGLLGGLGRAFLTGESFFFQKLVARRGPGWALLGQPTVGDIQAIELDGSQGYIVQKEGFLAGTESLEISTHLQNLLQGLGSGEGFFVIQVNGRGTLFVSSYGAIHPVDIPAGQDYIIDNHHLVAWPETMQYQLDRASNGWISTFTSGEMIVCRFRGPGRVYIQTRNPPGFGAWVAQFLPTPSSSSSTAGGIADFLT